MLPSFAEDSLCVCSHSRVTVVQFHFTNKFLVLCATMSGELLSFELCDSGGGGRDSKPVIRCSARGSATATRRLFSR